MMREDVLPCVVQHPVLRKCDVVKVEVGLCWRLWIRLSGAALFPPVVDIDDAMGLNSFCCHTCT